jgi:hypothetical protein
MKTDEISNSQNIIRPDSPPNGFHNLESREQKLNLARQGHVSRVIGRWQNADYFRAVPMEVWEP